MNNTECRQSREAAVANGERDFLLVCDNPNCCDELPKE